MLHNFFTLVSVVSMAPHHLLLTFTAHPEMCRHFAGVLMTEHLESFDSNQVESSSSSSSWIDELYDSSSSSNTSSKGSDRNGADSKSGSNSDDVSETFGTVEVTDSANTVGDAKPQPRDGGKSDAGPSSVGPSDSGQPVGDAKPSKTPEGAFAVNRDAQGVPIVLPTEQGEVIKRDVPPGVASGGSGDTLQNVARDHLGPGATQEEVDAHVKEIARINDIKDVKKPLDGSKIILPGHTSDGGFVTVDSEGNKRTIWHDNTVRIENEDRSGYVRHPNADGSARIHTWGPKPDQNADFIRTADGKYRIADGPDDKVGREPLTPQEKLLAERQRITDAADTKIANPEERARFKKDMQAFEDRMKQRAEEEKKQIDEKVKKNLLTPEVAAEQKAKLDVHAAEQTAETYKQTARIFEASDNPKVPLKEKDRTAIAEQIIHQAANPTSIDQGYHNTCNVATIETKLYTVEPSRAAEVIANVATTGKHQIPGPPPLDVEVDPNSIKPDREARTNPPKDGQRSHASQIFEVAAVNSFYAYSNSLQNPPGKIRYEQHEPGKAPDTGERLMDYSKNPPVRIRSKDDDGKLIDSPELTNDQLYFLEHQLRASNPDGTYLSNDRRDFNSTFIENDKQLESELARLKEQGKLPVTISVHTDNYPFHSDGGESAGGKGDWHVVTITDYHPGPPARAEIDNQWGSDDDRFGDRSLPVKDIFNAMRDPKDTAHIADLQLQIEKDRKEGKPIDTLKETELLRLKRRCKCISDDELSKELDRIFMEKARHFSKKLDEKSMTEADVQEYSRIMDEIRDIRATLPKHKQDQLNARLKKQMKEEKLDLRKR